MTDERRFVAAMVLMAILSVGMFVIGTLVGATKTRAEARQSPCVQAADRYELRETGVVGLMLRLDKQTGETVPVSAMSSR
jgi:hypothetical protein